MNDTPTVEAIWQALEARRHDIIAGFVKLLSSRSVTQEHQNAAACARKLQQQMKDLGFPNAPILESKHNPVVIADVPGPPGAPTVILYAHYDTKPADEQVGWGRFPAFQPSFVIGPPGDDARRISLAEVAQHRTEDLRLVCRGASDDKVGVWVALQAVAAAIRSGNELPVSVKFFFEGDEETGSPPLGEFLLDNRELLKADVVIVLDGAKAREGPRIYLGARGILAFEMKLTGAARDLHSGTYGDVITNPAEKLARFISSCQDAQGKVLIEGFYDAVAPPSAAQREAIARLPFDQEKVMKDIGASDDDWELPADRSYYEATMFWPTFNVDGFRSGADSTIVPSEATAWLDMRLVPNQSFDDIKSKVLKHLARQGLPSEVVTHFSGYDPYQCPVENPYARATIQAIKDVYGKDPLVYPSLGGSVPISLFRRVLGTHSIIVPLANHDSFGHGPRENLCLADLDVGIKTVVSILYALKSVR